MSAERADAVVVGGGPNGLAAAATLARAGRDVVLLEAAGTLGGAVRTEELTLPGFRHDVFSSVYPAGIASPVFEELEIERHGVRWIHPPVAMVHPLDGGTGGALYGDVDATAATLDELSPGDGAAWKTLVRPFLDAFPAVRQTFLSGFPPVAGPARLALAWRLHGMLDFARLTVSSARTVGERMFAHPGSRAWLYSSAMHGDVPPDGAGSAIAGIYLQVLGHAVGWPSPEGGAGAITDALTRALEEAGGRWHAGTPVTRVLTRNGRAAGVETAGGDLVEAPIVLCDLTPSGLLALAGQALPDLYVRRLVHFRHGPGTFKVDWALDGPVPWENEHARRAGTVHVAGDAEGLITALRQAMSGELPEKPFLLFGQQSLADPSRAPAGKHTAWAYTHTPRDLGWDERRDMFLGRVEAQVERFAPGFRDLILARHVMVPGDLADRDANLVGGDVGAGSYDLDQLLFRPVPKLSPYRTPLRGLYLGSAATFPGGAVHGVPGRAAARAALLDSRLRQV